MMREILVINSGSSSIKFALFGATQGGEPTNLELRYRGHFAGLGSQARLSLKDGEGEALDSGSAGPALSEVPADLDHGGALSKLLAWIEAHPDLEDIGAVGHRIVHGGRDHVDPVRLDADALDALEALVPLAPLHQPMAWRRCVPWQRCGPIFPRWPASTRPFMPTSPRWRGRFLCRGDTATPASSATASMGSPTTTSTVS
ncbi:hypothetical protein Q427_25780 [Halomonas sp. BC04]|nr:hypothetical protein Q427_25780 [Halomonas sp. BC04]